MERLIPVGTLPYKSSKDISFSKIGIGFEKLDRAVFDPEKAYDKVSMIGIKKIRIQSGWQRTEQTKGVYDFSWLDDIVDNLVARGMEPWLCLCYGNPLYTELAKLVFGSVGCPPVNTEEETEAWLRYVKATVEHFKDRISIYEVWNEPDCAYSWKHFDGETPDLLKNAKEYGEFTSTTAKAVKSVSPNAKVCATVAHLSDLAFTNNVLSAGDICDWIDYVIFHVYSVHDDKRHEQIAALRKLVKSHDPNIGLIQGESGSQSRSDGSGAMKRFAWSPEKQTKLLLRTLIQDLHSDLEFTSYFSTMDMIEALHGRVDDKASYLDYGYFGVISASFDEDGRANGQYTEKPSYYALSALCSLFEGDVRPSDMPYMREVFPSRRVNGYDCDDLSIKEYAFTLADGRQALCYWNSTPILTSKYEGTVTFSFFGQKTDNISLIDLKVGVVYALPEGMAVDTGNGGIRLLNLPLTDSPLTIVFG